MIDLASVGDDHRLIAVDLNLDAGAPIVLLGPARPRYCESSPALTSLAAASLVSVLPGLLVVWLARRHIATALSFGRQ